MEELGGYTVLQNPGANVVRKIDNGKFTGFAFYEYRLQPWSVWYKGRTIGFFTSPDQALAELRRANRFS